LLNNASVTQITITSSTEIQQEFQQIKQHLRQGFDQLNDKLDSNQQMLLSQIDWQFETLMRMTIDEAKDGPRLFSLVASRLGCDRTNLWEYCLCKDS
jgi:hypothetical protein